METNTSKFIKRDILEDLIKHLDKKQISLIIGPRQVGKTTLMTFLRDYLTGKNEKSLYLSLDFETDRKYFDSQISLIEKIRLDLGDKKGFVFIDEIQRKENAGIFLKGIYDMDLPYKFIVSGSGSVELKEKVHESLAGRKMTFEVEPVSFFEFFNYKTDYKYENNLEKYFLVEKDKSFSFLNEYLNFGGYPRVILAETLEEKKRELDEIFRSYIEKDIAMLLKVEKTDAFSSLIKILASQIGGILNYTEIANTLGISLPTVKNYIDYLEKTYIVRRISPFFRNTRKEISKSPIVYFLDLGLRNYALGALGNLTRPDDFGFLFQNLTFNTLFSHFKFLNPRINFWRTTDKTEVDFVINYTERIVPIEVKYKEFSTPVIARSLRSFIEKYNPDRALIITKDFSYNININKTAVEFMPFWLFAINLKNKKL
ncbi:MAG: ATP-binding protein [bacterium]|nr:ATP-binding protein [bacterium]